jgi:hypothetical protein
VIPATNSDLTHTAGTTLFNDTLDVGMTVTRLNYTNGGFICLANVLDGLLRCANQLNILTSGNGINWTLTKRRGYFSDAFRQGLIPTTIPTGGAYGQLSIIPDMSTLYFEFGQAGVFNNLFITEIQAFGNATSIRAPVGSTLSTIIDNKFNTVYCPNESDTAGLTDYTLTFTMASTVSTISELDIYIPNDATRLFTGIQVSQLPVGGITHYNTAISESNYSYDVAKGLNYYTAYMTPPLSNVSSLYINLMKTTPGSLQIAEFQAVNNLNKAVIQYVPTSVTDLDNYPPLNQNLVVGNTIDGNLLTSWLPVINASYGPTNAARLVFTFSPPAPLINRIQVFNGEINNYFYTATAIRIYTDASKSVLLFSKTGGEPPLGNIWVTNLTYQLIECDILPVTNVSDLYIEFDKSYENNNPIVINEVRFFGFGIPGDTSAGFTGGTLETMQRRQVANTLQDGGGGSALVGGAGGTDGTLPSRAVLFSNVVTLQTTVQTDQTSIASNLILFNNAQSTILGEIKFISTLNSAYDTRTPSTLSTVNGTLVYTSSLVSTYTSTIAGFSNTFQTISDAYGTAGVAVSNAQINYNSVYQYNSSTYLWEYIYTSLEYYDQFGNITYGVFTGDYTADLTMVQDILNAANVTFALNEAAYNAALNQSSANQSIYTAGLTTYIAALSTATRPVLYAPYVTNISTTSTSYGVAQTQLITDQGLLVGALFSLNNPEQGAAGFAGAYLTGGQPSSIGAGGGGGGFYGGGAGGRDVDLNGGAGGGGGGYFDSGQLVRIIEYGVGTPGNSATGEIQNFIPPFSTLQANLIASNAMDSAAYTYGAGGYGASGAHGVILVNYDRPTVVQPSENSMTATPTFIDGGQLTLFTSPISYATDIRTLPFTTYTEATQSTPYAGYNWVWFRSFLLMTGSSLLPSMTASSANPSFPYTQFPFLPNIVYTTLEVQYSNVLAYFAGNASVANTIVNSMQLAFELFNQFFINTPYTDPSYVQMTELYCLLDYLRSSTNFLNPHVNPADSKLDRVFGGLPRFGYWANPFLTNVSYVGFDVGQSLLSHPALSTLVGPGSQQVQAFYALTLEQSLSTGKYEYKEVMAYKPFATDSMWQTMSQFPESYSVRPLSNYYVNSNIVAQPYSAKSAIEGRLSLLNYRVYDAQATTYTAPIEVINDFQSKQTYLYSFQNSNATNVSSVNLLSLALTSTIVTVNQTNITAQSNLPTTGIMGTVVSEYRSSFLQAVQQFGFSSNSFVPNITFGVGTSNFYNTFSPRSQLPVSSIGKSITDYYGNLFASDNRGSSKLYENICTIQIFQVSFSNSPLKLASPKNILSEYRAGVQNPYYDFFQSRYKNIWHLQGTSNLSTIYGARLGSPYDFSIRTQFASQIFYPTHKIGLEQVGAGTSPIQNTYDLTDYPSYPKTQMFFYRNYSTLVADISGKFAMESTSNFAYSDTKFSGYFFNSFINNINMVESKNFDNNNTESFNYLAIRAYSPSETFKSLVRFYLPGRYDFGYISLADLSNEIVTLQRNSNVNPQYITTLGLFTSSFTGLKTFGGTGLANFSGLSISSPTFGNFLQQYSTVFTTINVNSKLVSSINSAAINSVTNLIKGDLRFILPSYVANRESVTDPVEYAFPLSTVMQASNRSIEAYGIGYNLGFAPFDTAFNTVQRANSFFKIFDDYIYMKMNVEQNMNRLDISRQENYSVSRAPTAESQLYNCKLILNTFGSFATTLVQNPVTFNPPIGKLDKLTFSWYDITGQLINNDTCVWSASIQVTETAELATADSTLPKMG